LELAEERPDREQGDVPVEALDALRLLLLERAELMEEAGDPFLELDRPAGDPLPLVLGQPLELLAGERLPVDERDGDDAGERLLDGEAVRARVGVARTPRSRRRAGSRARAPRPARPAPARGGRRSRPEARSRAAGPGWRSCGRTPSPPAPASPRPARRACRGRS